jgi:hypothetical protein
MLAEGLPLLYGKNCFGDECSNRAQHDDSLSLLAIAGPKNVSRIKTLRLVGDIEFGAEIGYLVGDTEYYGGSLQRLQALEPGAENQTLEQLFLSHPDLSGLEYIAISVPDLNSYDQEFDRLLDDLNLTHAWLLLRGEAWNSETWEENEEYGKQDEEEIVQKVRACALEKIILRASTATSQYPPSLAHFYEAIRHSTYNNLKSTSRIAFLCRKQIGDSAQCSTLHYLPDFNDVSPSPCRFSTHC